VKRQCGECFACCAHFHVPEVPKKAGEICPHVCAGGCAVYQSRPAPCREFECEWLKGTALAEGLLRPDKEGLVLDSDAHRSVLRVTNTGLREISATELFNIYFTAFQEGYAVVRLSNQNQSRVVDRWSDGVTYVAGKDLPDREKARLLYLRACIKTRKKVLIP
jgi:hypothetical protein